MLASVRYSASVAKGKNSTYVAVLLSVIVAIVGFRAIMDARQEPSVYQVVSAQGMAALRVAIVIRPISGGKPEFFVDRDLVLRIPKSALRRGNEWLIGAPGCGLLQGPVDEGGGSWFALFGERIQMPQPIRTTIKFPGDFDLPRGDQGLSLSFFAVGVDDHVAKVLDLGPVPEGYWSWPERARFSFAPIWVDPQTRKATVLLPRVGSWRVEWSNLSPGRAEPIWETGAFSMALGRGSKNIRVSASGETHSISVTPEELEMTE